MTTKKRCGKGDSSVKQQHHRSFLILTLALLAFLGPVGGGSQAPKADSLKTDSIDRCGNPKIITITTASQTVPADWPRAKKETLIESGPKGTAYFFLGSLCPCTDAHKQSIMELMSLAPKKGVKLVAVFPNRGESVELVEHFFNGTGFKMEYIIDSTNRWVRKFDAAKTPQVFLVNPKGRVVYAGPIDDAVENLGQIKNAYLKNALLELAEGRPVSVPRAEGSGCWIVRNR